VRYFELIRLLGSQKDTAFENDLKNAPELKEISNFINFLKCIFR
jgi:hypothetical protein